MDATQLRTLKITTIVVSVLYLLSLAFFAYTNWRAGAPTSALVGSTLGLALPMTLLFGSLWLLVAAWLQKRSTGAVSGRIARWVHYLPRIAGILIAVFISLFAMDVFEMEGSFWQLMGAFILHALPALVLLAFVAVAWKWPVVGFVGFTAGALYFLRYVVFFDNYSAGNFLLFTLPLAIVALLFYADWKWRAAPPASPLP